MNLITKKEALAAVNRLDVMPYFSNLSTDARMMLAERLTRLVNPDPEAVVNGICARYQVDRPTLGSVTAKDYAAVDAIHDIRSALARLGFTADEIRQYVPMPSRAVADLQSRFPARRWLREPRQRMEIFIAAFAETNPDGWPGIAEFVAQYGSMFGSAGDGSDCGIPSAPGHRPEDHETGTYVSMIPASMREPERPMLGAGEQRMTEQERSAWAREIEAAVQAKRLGSAGADTEAA